MASNKIMERFYFIDPLAIDETLQMPADVVNGKSLNRATKSESVFRSTCNVSHTFFFGFRTSSGSPSKPGNLTLSPMGASLGGSTNSTWIIEGKEKDAVTNLRYRHMH